MATSDTTVTIYKKQALDALEKARGIVISDGEGYRKAAELFKGIKAQRQAFENFMDPIVKAANLAHKTASSSRKDVVDSFRNVEAVVGEHMRRYDETQRAALRELQRKAEEAARQAAESVQIEQASRLENEGRAEEAQAVLSQKVAVAPVVVTQEKISTGIRSRKSYECAIVDASLVPSDYQMTVPDEKKIKAFVTATEGKVRIPGVEVREVVTHY